jgi:hypothetical protein
MRPAARSSARLRRAARSSQSRRRRAQRFGAHRRCRRGIRRGGSASRGQQVRVVDPLLAGEAAAELRWIDGSATLTTLPSRIAMLDPRIVAMSVNRLADAARRGRRKAALTPRSHEPRSAIHAPRQTSSLLRPASRSRDAEWGSSPQARSWKAACQERRYIAGQGSARLGRPPTVPAVPARESTLREDASGWRVRRELMWSAPRAASPRRSRRGEVLRR